MACFIEQGEGMTFIDFFDNMNVFEFLVLAGICLILAFK